MHWFRKPANSERYRVEAPFMAHKRKDTLARVKVNNWAKHLRPYGKRQQAQVERRAAKKEISGSLAD